MNILSQIEKMGEIYKITNTMRNKIYIGQARQKSYNNKPRGASVRFKEHLRCKRRLPLYEAIQADGKDVFELEILLCCPIEMLDYYEQKFIRLCDATNPLFGYNILTESLGASHDPRIREKRSIAMKKKWKESEFRASQSKIFLELWKDSGYRDKQTVIRGSTDYKKMRSDEMRHRNSSSSYRNRIRESLIQDRKLPPNVYEVKKDGKPIGYVAQMSIKGKRYQKDFRSQKISMETKLKLATEYAKKFQNLRLNTP
jgi:group I intron endonuclease